MGVSTEHEVVAGEGASTRAASAAGSGQSGRGARLVWRIATREWRDLARDGRFALAAPVLLLVLGASLWLGIQRYTAAHAQQAVLSAAERDRWLTQGERHPHSAAHQGFWLFQPAAALATFDQGIRTHAGAGVHLEAHSQRLFRYRPAEDGTWVQRAGELTAALTLQKVVPLLIVLIGFGLFAGERERGTLRLVSSVGVSRRTLLLGKAFGLLVPLGSVLVTLSLVGAAALALHTATDDPHLALRSILLAAGYLAYFMVFVGITLAVTAHAATSRRALAVLTGIWVVAVVLTPPLIVSAAARWHPTPTALEFAAGLQHARADGPLWYERLLTVEERLLREHRVSALTDLPVNAQGVAMYEEEAGEGALHDVQFRRLYDAYRHQGRLVQAGTLVSPVLAMQMLSMRLAGTSLEHHLDFANAAESYRNVFVQAMNEDLAKHDKPAARRLSSVSGTTAPVYLRGRELWETISAFTYAPPSATWLMARCRGPAASLLGWVLTSAAATLLAWRRFTVELP